MDPIDWEKLSKRITRNGGEVSENHTANFIEGMQARKQPISDVLPAKVWTCWRTTAPRK